jgi:hypothetical protein
MSNKTGFWDHRTKPSLFVVFEDGKEIFRGTFKDGYEILNKQRKSYQEKVAEYFSQPDCLTPQR